MTLRVPLLWLLLLVASSRMLAQTVYVCSLSDLYQLNLQTCNTTLIGRMPTLMNDIALLPNNVLYGVSGNYGNPALAQTLFRINQATGAGTAISRLDYTINGLVAGPDGVLYGAGAFGEFVTIEPITGTTTLLGNTGFPCQGDLAFYQNRLYMAATGNRLVEVNLRNPMQSRLIGQMSMGSDVLGLATVGVETCESSTLELYATSGSGLYQLNPATGRGTLVCTYGLATIDGAASPIESAPLKRPTAGLDSVARVCATIPAVSMGQYLFRADAGGRWRVASGNGRLAGDVYTPGTPSNTQPDQVQYIVGTGLCADTAVISLNFQALPRITNFAVTPTGCTYGDGKLEVTADGFQPLLYALDSLAQGTANPVFTNLSLRRYTVYLTDQFGCRGHDTVTITNACVGNTYLPTAFSPNGDRLNDTFAVHLSEGDAFVERLTIFDRWGGVVFNRDEFTIHNGDTLWDGMINGAPPEIGTYTYQLLIRYSSGLRYTFWGNVAALR